MAWVAVYNVSRECYNNAMNDAQSSDTYYNYLCYVLEKQEKKKFEAQQQQQRKLTRTTHSVPCHEAETKKLKSVQRYSIPNTVDRSKVK